MVHLKDYNRLIFLVSNLQNLNQMGLIIIIISNCIKAKIDNMQ